MSVLAISCVGFEASDSGDPSGEARESRLAPKPESVAGGTGSGLPWVFDRSRMRLNSPSSSRTLVPTFLACEKYDVA